VLVRSAREKAGVVILHPTAPVSRVLEISVPGGVLGLEVRD
jgi:hypothetical protein